MKNVNLTAEEIEERKNNDPDGKLITYRKDYLIENKPDYYAELVKNGKPREELWDLHDRVTERKEQIISDLKKSAEWEKANSSGDYMAKVQLSYQYEAAAEEIICNELIYV